MAINDIGFEKGRVVRHHNLLATLGKPNITGPINRGKGRGNTAGKGHGKGNGAGGGAAAAPPMESVQVALRTTTGTQDITIPNFGSCSGAFFILSQATAVDTSSNFAQSFGCTDGTNSRLNATSQTTSGQGYRAKTASVAGLINATTPFAWTVRAEFDSFITDGLRINVSVSDGTARLLTVILFKDTLDVAVGDYALSTTGTVVTPGFETKLLLTGHTATFTDTGAAGIVQNIGIATWDGTTVRQGAIGHSYSTPGGTGQNIGRIRNDRALVLYNSTLALSRNASAGTFTSTSFTMTSDPSSGNVGWYMAVGGLTSVWSGVMDSPTSTGVQPLTDAGVSFTPKMALIMPTAAPALTEYTDGSMGAVGFGFATANSEASHTFREEDNDISEIARVFTATRAITLNYHTGAVAFWATLDGFVSTGANFNFTSAGGSAGKFLVFYGA